MHPCRCDYSDENCGLQKFATRRWWTEMKPTGWTKKLHNEICSRYFSKQIDKKCQTQNSEQVFSVSSLLLDDTFQPVTPLIDGAVSEALRQFAPLRDDCTLELLSRLITSHELTQYVLTNHVPNANSLPNSHSAVPSCLQTIIYVRQLCWST